MNKGVVAFWGYDLVVCLYEGVVTCLNNDNNDIRNSHEDCFECFLLKNPLESLFEVTWGEKCIIHHSYIK